jgi:heat shock protein HslJ/membrane-bound inhibitor of C-type lysozyme
MFRKSALSLALSCAAALPAAAQDDDTRTVKGSLGYLQRIALPDEAQAHVVAEGRFGAILGETVLDPDGRQVPLPFEMTVPADLAGTLGAVIRIENRARWLIEGVNFPAGRDTVDLGELTLSPVTPLAFATDFVCGDTPVSVGVLDDEMVMRAEDRDIRLEQVRAASGARYEAVSEPGTSVWNKGEEISVTLNGRDLPDCVRVTPAAMEPYRARGNEPGWHVALDGDTARVVADYGEIELETERPEVAVVPGAYVFDMPGIDASLRIEEGLCHDDATGMPYPDAARLTLGTRELRGCGGDPADLLTGETWRITALGDAALIEPERLSLSFFEPGRVAGSSGCNRLIGGFKLTGEGLSFERMGSTMMACEDAIMAQERRMLDALEQVRRFDVTAEGTLLLIGGSEDSVLIEAQRP